MTPDIPSYTPNHHVIYHTTPDHHVIHHTSAKELIATKLQNHNYKS